MKRLYSLIFVATFFHLSCEEDSVSECDSLRQDNYEAYIAFSEVDTSAEDYDQICQNYVDAYEKVLDAGCAGFTSTGLSKVRSGCSSGNSGGNDDGGDGDDGGGGISDACDTDVDSIRIACLIGIWSLDSIYRYESYSCSGEPDTIETFSGRYRIFNTDSTTCEVYSSDCQCVTERYVHNNPSSYFEEILIGESVFNDVEYDLEEMTETNLILESNIWIGGQPQVCLTWFFSKVESIEGCDL